ncbi:TerC [Escherichia coli]|nr:TerC [Escherichia coli]
MVSTHIGFPTETVIVFIALSVGAIFIDLFMHRDDKPISLKSAALWSVFWVVVAMHLPVSSTSTTVLRLPACL